MLKKNFYLFLIGIVILGLCLRLIDYDHIPPFGETKDEFLYPWIGISLIKTGIPTGWSLLPSYSNVQDVMYWGEHFRLTSPWLEKPPIYSLLVGSFSLLNGEDVFDQVRLSTVRIVPIILSLISLLFIGLLGAKAFHPTIGLVAMIIYATSPIMVMSNRMSVTENLVTPTFLIGLWIFYQKSNPIIQKYKPLLYALLTIMVLLTKQTGIALPLIFIVNTAKNKKWKNLIGAGVGTFIALSLMPILGFLYGWDFYQQLQKDLFIAVNHGLPETFTNFFRFLGVGHKESLFLDGSLVAGFILLFAAPFIQQIKAEFPKILVLPYLYIIVLILLLSGATWYGWYVFPLYPFLSLVLATNLYNVLERLNYFQYVFFFIFLGSSSIRFLLLISKINLSWQPLLAGVFITFTVLWTISNTRFKSVLLIVSFCLYVMINIYTVLNLNQIYPSKNQPENSLYVTEKF